MGQISASEVVHDAGVEALSRTGVEMRTTRAGDLTQICPLGGSKAPEDSFPENERCIFRAETALFDLAYCRMSPSPMFIIVSCST